MVKLMAFIQTFSSCVRNINKTWLKRLYKINKLGDGYVITFSGSMWDVIIYSHLNFNAGLIKPPLELRY